jgi:AmmeMemoRadiSam system protein A
MAKDARGERLVRLAREAIVHALGGPPFERPTGAWFEEHGASFVTITREGRLHGCIGSLVAHQPLAADVEQNAIAAAFRDPRSMPLQVEQLPEIGVEVTRLGPLVPMRFTGQEDLLKQLVPHVDGLVLRWRRHRGTFLPQVWESLEEPAIFLGELKAKAGLSRDFWADDVEVSRFAVDKWGDRRAPGEARATHEASS